jgi:hypothetical protein
MVYAGQGVVVKPLEDLAFKDKALPILLVRTNHLFEGKHLILGASLADEIDSTRSALAKQTLDHIAVSQGISYGHSAGKLDLSLLHTPPHTEDS